MSTGIGLRIKNRRTELGLSQEELATRMGLTSKSTICKVERGDDNLTADRVMKYADALETTGAYLMGWYDDEPETTHDPAEIEQAMKLFEKYQNAIPEIQSAVDSLLKSQSRNS